MGIDGIEDLYPYHRIDEHGRIVLTETHVPVTAEIGGAKWVVGQAHVELKNGVITGKITSVDPAAADLLKKDLIGGMCFSVPIDEVYVPANPDALTFDDVVEVASFSIPLEEGN